MEFRPDNEKMVEGPATGHDELLTAQPRPNKDVSPFQAEANLKVDVSETRRSWRSPTLSVPCVRFRSSAQRCTAHPPVQRSVQPPVASKAHSR